MSTFQECTPTSARLTHLSVGHGAMTRRRSLAQYAWRRRNASPQPRPNLAHLTSARPVCSDRACRRDHGWSKDFYKPRCYERTMAHAVRVLVYTFPRLAQRALRLARRAFILTAASRLSSVAVQMSASSPFPLLSCTYMRGAGASPSSFLPRRLPPLPFADAIPPPPLGRRRSLVLISCVSSSLAWSRNRSRATVCLASASVPLRSRSSRSTSAANRLRAACVLALSRPGRRAASRVDLALISFVSASCMRLKRG